MPGTPTSGPEDDKERPGRVDPWSCCQDQSPERLPPSRSLSPEATDHLQLQDQSYAWVSPPLRITSELSLRRPSCRRASNPARRSRAAPGSQARTTHLRAVRRVPPDAGGSSTDRCDRSSRPESDLRPARLPDRSARREDRPRPPTPMLRASRSSSVISVSACGCFSAVLAVLRLSALVSALVSSAIRLPYLPCLGAANALPSHFRGPGPWSTPSTCSDPDLP